MSAFESHKPGTPSWVDLSSTDPKSSAAFYGSLFGWDVVELGPEAGGYQMCSIGGKAVAGIGGVTAEGQPSAWTTYISVDDADAAVARVTEAGGSVLLPPMDVLDAGRMSVFMDPTGAALALWQPRRHKGAELKNEPGTICWAELNTRDTTAAMAFYASVFGWDAESEAMGDMTYTVWKLDGEPFGGMMEMGGHFPPEVPAHWLTYFSVADADATVSSAADLGATVVVPVTAIEPGRFSVLIDPAGAAFAIIQ